MLTPSGQLSNSLLAALCWRSVCKWQLPPSRQQMTDWDCVYRVMWYVCVVVLLLLWSDPTQALGGWGDRMRERERRMARWMNGQTDGWRSSPLASWVLLVLIRSVSVGSSRGATLEATLEALCRSDDRALISADLFRDTRDGSLWTTTHTHVSVYLVICGSSDISNETLAARQNSHTDQNTRLVGKTCVGDICGQFEPGLAQMNTQSHCVCACTWVRSHSTTLHPLPTIHGFRRNLVVGFWRKKIQFQLGWPERKWYKFTAHSALVTSS